MTAERGECRTLVSCTPSFSINSDLSVHVSHRPEVTVHIFTTSSPALLDSGASISAISEDFFSELKKIAPTPKSLSILPVTGVTISTAVRSRSRKITHQVLIPIQLYGNEAPGVFLVVPHLTTSLILGDDWLTQHGVIINYLTKEIEFPYWKKSCPFLVDKEKFSSSQNTHLNVSFTSESLLPTALEHCLSSIISYDKFSILKRSTDLSIRCLTEESTKTTVSEKQFKEHLASITSIDKDCSDQLVHLLAEFHDIFSDCPGLNNVYTCSFDVTENVPFKIKPYPIPFSRRPAVEKELDRMLKWGVIERSSSPYSNPIVCVGKADGSVRLCLDARRINQLILPMRDSSPPLDELLSCFGGKKMFSSLDFTAGYWQVPLHPTVRKYTAFVYNGKTYHFCVVPFGLNISNTAFGHALESVLNIQVSEEQDDQMKDLHIYVDDLLISTTTFPKHLLQLRILFTKIRMSGMTLKLAKCEFLRQKIKFLGHIISPFGLSMDPEKLRAIHEFPQPRSKKELQSFVGFVNFYRKFACNHASIISPLIDIIKKGEKWRFGKTELEMFENVKKSFTEVYLCHPCFDRPFYLQTDASKLGLGAELFQLSNDGERHTIAFASKTLNAAEKNYSITELELLSIVFACGKFRVFILGYPVYVLTDHQALTFLFQCRLRNSRLTRWTLLLQEFNLQIKYIPGIENVVDALSRNPVGRDEEGDPLSNLPSIMGITSKAVLSQYQLHLKTFSSILLSQREDINLSQIIDSVKSNLDSPWLSHYCIFENVLFYRRHPTTSQWLVCVPSKRVDELIVNVHCHFGHVGPKKCILSIRDFCYFKKLYSRVRLLVRQCDVCQRAKVSTTRTEGELKPVLANVPLGRLLVDIYGPLPLGWNQVRYIFVVLDNFSRFVRLYPIKKATAVTVTNRMVSDYIGTYGVPRCVVSDHGVQFVSKVWQRSLSSLGVPPTTISVYHPQSNPAERVMRELGRMFRTYCHNQHTEWPRYINYIEWVLNNTVHEATGYTPQELFSAVDKYNPFSKVISFPLQVPVQQKTKFILAREVQLSHAERRKQRHDRQGPSTEFTIGMLVLVRTHRLSSAVDRTISKFFLLYEGPYVIVKKSTNVYTVADPDTQHVQGTYNVIHLRQYYTTASNPLQQAEAVAVSQIPKE